MSVFRGVTVFLLFVMLLSACGKKATVVPVSLSASKALLRLGLDENTSNISEHLEYYYDQQSRKEFLFSLNTIKNEIQIYDLQNSQLVKNLTFTVEGDRGVGNISAFHVHNLDSIFLFPGNGNRMFLTDSDIKSIQRINYQVPDGYGNAIVSSTYFSAKPYLQHGKLVTKTLYQGNYSTIDNQELSTRHVSYAVVLNSGKAINLSSTYPDDYWADVKKHFQFSFSANENGNVYSFWGDHSLYLSKGLDAEWTKVSARSTYLREQWEALPLGGTRMDRTRYFAASAHYGNIIYDPYREVYYRFVYPKVEVENEQDLRQLALYPVEFSIMILDKNLNILGEKFFKEPFVTSNVFVGKEGLYMSINHPSNLDNQEDFLSFRLYQLTGLPD